VSRRDHRSGISPSVQLTAEADTPLGRITPIRVNRQDDFDGTTSAHAYESPMAEDERDNEQSTGEGERAIDGESISNSNPTNLYLSDTEQHALESEHDSESVDDEATLEEDKKLWGSDLSSSNDGRETSNTLRDRTVTGESSEDAEYPTQNNKGGNDATSASDWEGVDAEAESEEPPQTQHGRHHGRHRFARQRPAPRPQPKPSAPKPPVAAPKPAEAKPSAKPEAAAANKPADQPQPQSQSQNQQASNSPQAAPNSAGAALSFAGFGSSSPTGSGRRLTAHQLKMKQRALVLKRMGLKELPPNNHIRPSADVIHGEEALPELDDTDAMLDSLGLKKYAGVVQSYVNADPDLVDVAIRTDGDDLIKIQTTNKGLRLLGLVGLRVEVRAKAKKMIWGGESLDVLSFKVMETESPKPNSGK